ncbi:MAG: serine/threonine protein kinase [Candidatus Bathyarchaeota archaeon]|nr:serine/threonine protein kinase [Candidatus Bathyarchaeota archaeon]MDH5779934.1 serine/threonine protein kinase [Candidatus Bathyarchaeota archaeon]
MPHSEMVPLERLHEEKYARILCYPRYDVKEVRRRVKELEELEVKALELTGEKTVFNLPVLGKGYVGIVVAASMDGRRVALKIRRVDADRTGMRREADMLRKANTVDVGPNLIDATETFLVMELIEGTLLPRWVEALNERVKPRMRRVLRDVLEQCWRLDKVGLDHGELSRAPKHIIVDAKDKPCIVDFETASTRRRVSNATSICHYLFMGSQTAKTIEKVLDKISKEELIRTLRAYKQKPTREKFEKVLGACDLNKV